MERRRLIPGSVDELLGEHGWLMVHLKGVHRDDKGRVWIRSDAPVKLPLLLINPENWLSVASQKGPDGVFHLCACPGSDSGVVAWKNMAPVRPEGTTWTLAEFTAQS